MIIAVAGPYTAPTAEERETNADRMNKAAAQLLEIGHTPIIGINAALPVLEHSNIPDTYEAIMSISMAVISCCEGILMIGESKGANRERDWFINKGLPVYYNINEIPDTDQH